MMNRIRIVGMFLMVHNLIIASGTDYYRVPYYYKDQVITIDNLLDLAPPVPEDINKAVQNWLIKNGSLVRILSGIDGYMVSPAFPVSPYECGDIGVGMYHAQAKNILYNLGWENKSDSGNWVLKVADDWYLKASGLPRRLKVINDWLQLARGVAVSHASLVNYVAVNQGTTPFVSRMASYLRIKDIVEREKLSIVLPELYFIHIPGRPLVLRDENYILFERSVGNDVVYLEESTYALDQALIMDLVKLIGYTGFSNISKSFVVTKQGNVCLLDSEMSFQSDNKYFFTGNIKQYEDAILRGWQLLYDNIILQYASVNNIDIPASVFEAFRKAQQEVVARLSGQIVTTTEDDNFLQINSTTDDQEVITE